MGPKEGSPRSPEFFSLEPDHFTAWSPDHFWLRSPEPCSLLAEVLFFCVYWTYECGKRDLCHGPWVETHFDPNAVRDLGRHCSKRTPHDIFADCQ